MPAAQDSTALFPAFPIGGSQKLNRFSQAFPDPYLDYASTQMPRSIYDVLRWCFPPDTLVHLADGRIRRIADILPGDLVLNRFGKAAKVELVSKRPYTGTLIEIVVRDASGVPIAPTSNHNMFCARPARLKPGRVENSLGANKVEKIRADELRLGDYLVSPQPTLGRIEPPHKDLDPYIAGLYLGDGWPLIRSSRKVENPSNPDFYYGTRWRFSSSDRRAQEELGSRLEAQGLSLSVGLKCADGAQPSCHDKNLIQLLIEHCGKGATGKRIGPALYGWSREQLLQLLAGYVDSDGHVQLKNGKVCGVVISSVSCELLSQVQRLCHAIEMAPCLGKRSMGGYGGLVKAKSEGFTLFFNRHELEPLLPYCHKLKRRELYPKTRSRTASIVFKDGIVFRRIVKLREVDYAGYVHNFEVEGEHSYLVSPYIATSNCEFVWVSWGVYRMAAQRVVRYFLTQIELTDASDDEKEKYEEFTEKQLRLMASLATAGDNLMAYGNCFISLYVPFRRHLRCPKCHIEQPIGRIEWTFSGWAFKAKCGDPKCKYEGEFIRVDRRSLNQDKIKYVFWPPHEMRLMYHPVSQKVEYLWNIPEYFKQAIRSGNAFYLESTPWEIVDAIKNDQIFRFAEDVIFHMRDTVISGVRTFGWGVPLVMSNFKQAWYIQVLKRYNEAIALDYIIPFRVLTPSPGSSKEADPLLNMNLSNFQQRTMAMFRQHRRDPTTIHALPFPVNLQLLGAEGKDLAPTELLDAGVDEFLNAQGVPAEMYKGTLQWQAMPTALRLFERTWVSMVTNMNEMINWTFQRISKLKNWESLKGRLQPVTMADDIEKKQIQLQLAAGQQISRQTALAPFGINYRDEIKRVFEEEQYTQEEMARFQEEMAQRQELQSTFAQGAAGAQPAAAPGMAPAGAPAAAGGMMPAAAPPASGGMTPEDMTLQAEQIAQQMLAMPFEIRKSELLKIKKSNETLHALVISKMQAIRQQAKTQGGYQVLQQMSGAGATM